jgi:RHS repeat-associated protein
LTAGYRGDGLRAWKESAGGRTYFIYDGALPVVEMDSAGAVVASNTFGANGLLSRRAGAASTFYAFDPQGSVTQRLDESGAVLSNHLFKAHGDEVTAAGADPFGYGARWGYYTDSETGLQLLTNRYYDPQAGRFVTRDPISYNGGVNLYAYVVNNPANRIDPFGLQGNIPDPNNPPSDWTSLGPNTWRDPNGDTWHWHPDPTGDHGGDHWDIGGPRGPNGEKGEQEWWPNRPGGQREPKPPGGARFEDYPGFPLMMPPFPASDPWTCPAIPPPTPQQQAGVGLFTTGVLIVVIIVLLPVGA